MAVSDIFRVKIDLGQFYSDYKSQAYVSVNPEWKNVRQFHRHITEMFDVKKFVLLTDDGVYLPAKEHIGIIQSGDIIRVAPKHDDNESVVSAPSETLHTLTERNVNEHLRTRDFGTFKIHHSVSPSIEVISSKKSNTTIGIGGGGRDGDDDDFLESAATNDTSGSAGSKRKRVRHRKKKNNSIENDENQMNVPNVESAFTGILKQNPFTSGAVSKISSKSNTHVRFEDDELLSELDEEVALPKRARIIPAKVMGIIQIHAKTVQENGEKSSVNDIEEAAIEEPKSMPEDKLMNGNEVDIKSTANEIEPKSALEQLAQNIDEIEKYKDMNNDAKEMDMIAFKVFTPSFEMSDYVIGLVEKIIGEMSSDQQDYDLVLQIMAGSHNIEHLKDPNVDANENIRIQINRMDIFNAKIVTL